MKHVKLECNSIFKREFSLILDLLCSSIGSLTNPNNVANALNTKQNREGKDTVSINTVESYMDNLADAFFSANVNVMGSKARIILITLTSITVKM